MKKLKVVSLNAWMGNYWQRIVEFLKQEEPDVVLLQEVTRGVDAHLALGVSDSVKQIAGELRYEWVFEPMIEMKTRKHEYEVGVGILTKKKMKKTEARGYWGKKIKLGGSLAEGDLLPGILVEAEVVPGVWVGVTHFLWSMHPLISQEQMKAVEKLIELVAGRENMILGGDFNVTDDTVIYEKLKEVMRDDRPLGCRRTLHPVIHRAGEHNLAVDYLWSKGARIKLLETRVVEVGISDHMPLVAWYEVLT